jgi:hypothetical protein
MCGARRRLAGTILNAIGLLAVVAAPTALEAQDTATTPGWTPLAQALKATVETGRPTLVIVTSRHDPGSNQLRASLAGILQTQPVGGQVQLAEMPSEAHATRLQQMGVTSVPTALVYTREGAGLRLSGYRVGMSDPYQLAGWLASVPLAPSAAAPAPSATSTSADSGIVRTGLPSTQGQQPTPQAVPTPQVPHEVPHAPPVHRPVYQPPVTIPAQMPPVVTAPPLTPTVVSPPASTFVVQPQPATLVMAPAPQPNIIFAGSAPSVPTISVAQPGAAPPAGGAPVNLITQPAAAPPAGGAPPPGAAPPTFALAPPTPAQAPQVGQAPQAGQGPITTALITMVAPSLFDTILGAIGERLRQRRLPRMEMAQAPVVSSIPGALAPPAVGMAPTGLAPMPGYAPPQIGYMPVGPPYPAYPQGYAPPPYGPEYGPPPPMPSAQGYGYPAMNQAPRKSGWFSRK